MNVRAFGRQRRCPPEEDGLALQFIGHAGVERSLSYMAAHYDRPMNLSILQKVSGLSFRALHQAFLRHAGCSPGRLLRNMRIERAKKLLLSDFQIRVVASACGFRRLNSFEVAFKNATGLSPREFRQQARRPKEEVVAIG